MKEPRGLQEKVDLGVVAQPKSNVLSRRPFGSFIVSRYTNLSRLFAVTPVLLHSIEI